MGLVVQQHSLDSHPTHLSSRTFPSPPGHFLSEIKKKFHLSRRLGCDMLTLMYRKREQNLLSCFLLSTAFVWPLTSPAWFGLQEPLCKTAEVLLLLYPASHREVSYLTMLLIVQLDTTSFVCEWSVSRGHWWDNTGRVRAKYLEKQIFPSASLSVINFYLYGPRIESGSRWWEADR